jgi:hypothetical protein
MGSALQHEQDQQKSKFSLRITVWDMLTGLPAGVLIFMSTVLCSALISLYGKLSVGVGLLILVSTSLFVGWLAGLTRLRQGPATGLSAGLIAAGILGYLWLAARPGDEFNPLVIGPLGMFITISISPIGGWLGAKSRKAI